MWRNEKNDHVGPYRSGPEPSCGESSSNSGMTSVRPPPRVMLNIPLSQPYLGAPVGRNERCPCKSGRKFKRCCLGSAPRRVTVVPPEVVAAHEARFREIEEQRRLHVATRGHARPMLHNSHHGRKVVVVGRNVFFSSKERPWRTFHDFLMHYGRERLGKAWGAAQQRMLEGSRHPLYTMHDALVRHLAGAASEQGDLEIFSAAWNGGTAGFLTFAHDLCTLADNAELQKVLLKRLRDPRSYQGARHELFAAATMVRAGFELAFENERDGSTKHPEFIATLKSTGVRVAVEAKSRHRPGVLGQPGTVNTTGRRAEAKGLFLRALVKEPQMPFAIFLDVNLPPAPSIGPARLPAWLDDWERDLSSLTPEQWAGFNIVVTSNLPFHHDPGGSGPWNHSIAAHGSHAPRFALDPEVIARIGSAAQLATSVPSEFPPNPNAPLVVQPLADG